MKLCSTEPTLNKTSEYNKQYKRREQVRASVRQIDAYFLQCFLFS